MYSGELEVQAKRKAVAVLQDEINRILNAGRSLSQLPELIVKKDKAGIKDALEQIASLEEEVESLRRKITRDVADVGGLILNRENLLNTAYTMDEIAGYITGIAFKLSNIKENESYTLSGEGKAPVGFANGSANVRLDEENEITTLTYDVNIDVGGKIAQLGSRLIGGVAKKMSDYFFGRFADLVSPIKNKNEDGTIIEKKRVEEVKSNFLNKYIYAAIVFFVLLTVVIYFFI